jgi:hypothetical protein
VTDDTRLKDFIRAGMTDESAAFLGIVFLT